NKARTQPAGQAPTECLRRTVQQDRALRMAVPISLGRSGPCTTRRHAVDVVLQSRAPKYGSGRIYPKTAARHGRVAFLLLAIAINGGDYRKGKRFDSTDDLFKGLGREVKFRRYHTADYLKTEHDIAASLDAVRDDGDLALIEAARDDVNRARA